MVRIRHFRCCATNHLFVASSDRSSEEESARRILDRHNEPRKNSKDGQAARVKRKKGKRPIAPFYKLIFRTAVTE